jgi:hypothetical protein
VVRQGWLGAGVRSAVRRRTSRFDAFLQGLRTLGYVNGETITIDYLFPADGRSERFPALAADCLRLQADIIQRC